MNTKDWPALPDLRALLLKLNAEIPPGCVTTYGQLADALGSRKAALWIAKTVFEELHVQRLSQSAGSGEPMLASNVPVHRVSSQTGQLPGREREDQQFAAERLRHEGVLVVEDDSGFTVSSDRRVAPNSFPRPLQRLQAYQQECARQIADSAAAPLAWSDVRLVAGVDVSYISESEGIAACVVVERAGREPLAVRFVRQPILFPYISTFLAFREIPAMRAALELAVRDFPQIDLVLVDGSGNLHPERLGIGTHLGWLTGMPTVGVSKTRLTGSWNRQDLAAGRPQPIHVGEQLVGMAIQPERGRPLFASPGYRATVSLAAEATLSLLHGFKSPGPLLWADRHSRQEVRRLRPP